GNGVGKEPRVEPPTAEDGKVADTAKQAAEGTKAAQPKDDKPDPVDVTVRRLDAPTPEAVAKEAEKGYDLLFVGIENTHGRNGTFHRDVDRIVGAFDGPTAIVAAKNGHLEQPEQSPLNILVPVSGTDVSRRAAELAIGVARVVQAPVTAIYLAGERPRHEQAILKEIVEIADGYDQQVETAVRTDVAPDEAVIAAAKKGGHNVIIMGVSRRPGDTLFFGETAAGIFDNAPISVVFVAS